MFDDEKGYYEIQLDNKWLIIIFIIFVVILGMVFVWGMKVGKDTAELEFGIKNNAQSSGEKNTLFTEQDLTGQKGESSWNNTSKKDDLETFDLKTELIGDKKQKSGSSDTKKNDSETVKNEKPVPSSNESKEKQSSSNNDDSQKTKSTDNPYIIQILSIKDKEKAEYYTKVLKDEGYPASMTTVELGAQGYFYRVRVGGYQTREAAQTQISKILNEAKLQPILKGKKNLLIIKQF
jgi:cell division septation protein DedD